MILTKHCIDKMKDRNISLKKVKNCIADGYVIRMIDKYYFFDVGLLVICSTSNYKNNKSKSRKRREELKIITAYDKSEGLGCGNIRKKFLRGLSKVNLDI